MIHLPDKSIQNVNMVFSCGAILMLVMGIIMENWVEFIPKLKKEKTGHSPWLGCCPASWPEGGLKIIKSMMMMSLNIAIYINLILGLQYTSMISQNKWAHLIIGFINFFTVSMYYHKIKKGQDVYFVSYKIKRITFTVYLAIALFLTCGIFCFIQCSNRCACLLNREGSGRRLSGSSIQVISLPERTIMPRSIVHVHSSFSKDDNKPHVQTRRVTWAL
nr:transmembrane protein 225 isoform X2 [Myodes glareolus]